MNSTKIQFSREEMILAANAEWILTKNTIIRKVQELFGVVLEKIVARVKDSNLPPEVKETNPKISKGENYLGLPYVMLDYPRLFKKEETFAIRIMFWWAHYFTVTLHLKGACKDEFLPRILKNLPLLTENNFYLGISQDEWIHALEEKAYVPFREMRALDISERLKDQEFLKITAKLRLDEANEAEEKLVGLVQKIWMALEI
ncbi:MAG TPA: hypothetical protein VFV08_05820 [Puia sp.]|nr:hypothetical protein [Puia sp.]